MTEVFISYAREEEEFVRRLKDALAQHHREAWLDQEKIPYTAEWWKEIEKAIEFANAFIFIITPDSLRSDVCQRELSHAIENHKRLVPLKRAEVRDEDVPDSIRKLQWLEFSQAADFNANLETLIRTLDTDLDWVNKHTEYQTKALEWQSKGGGNLSVLRGKDLDEAEAWLDGMAGKDPEPTRIGIDFIRFSRQAASRRLLWFAVSGVSAAIIVAILAIVAWIQRDEAIKQRTHAVSRQLAAQASLTRTEAANQLELAVLLGIHSAQLVPSAEADRVIRVGHKLLPVPLGPTLVQGSAVDAVAFSADGRYFATGQRNTMATVWDTDTRQLVSRMKLAGSVSDLAFSPDGRFVAAVSHGRDGWVWNVRSGKRVRRLHHNQSIYAVTFSPNGDYIATASIDGTAILWPLSRTRRKGPKLRALKHQGWVQAASFSPDGLFLATGSDDRYNESGSVKIWDVKTGRKTNELAHGISDQGLAFSPDGRYLVTAGSDGAAQVWEIETDKIVTLSHQNAVRSVAFSPDGKLVATGSEGGVARVWDWASGGEIARLTFQDSIHVVAFSPDGEYVLAGSLDGTARVFAAHHSSEVARMVHQNMVLDVAFAPNGHTVATGSLDGTSRLWDVKQNLRQAQFHHHDWVNTVAFSPDGTLLATGSGDPNKSRGTVRIWRLEAYEEIAKLEYKQFVDALAFSPNSRLLASGSWGGSVAVLDVATGEVIWHTDNLGKVQAVAFSRDSAYIATASKKVNVFDSASGRVLASLDHDDSVSAVAFSPDGQLLAIGPFGGKPELWRWSSRENPTLLDITRGVVQLDISPGGKFLAVADGDPMSGGSLYTWDIAKGQTIARRDIKGEIKAVVFSPDGRHLGVATTANNAWLLDTATANVIARLGHNDFAGAIAFSPDGKYIATGSWDGTARVWQTDTHREVFRFVHEVPVHDVAFSPDGNHLATGFSNGSAVYELRIIELIEKVCLRLTRNFSGAEWQRYLSDYDPSVTCKNHPVPVAEFGSGQD